MKKIILSIGFLIAIAGFSGMEAANINVNVNIGVQPAWGPVGYNYAAFYYFPDINVYYNVNQSLFHFSQRGRWVSARYLPFAYRNYDLYGLYKVVIADNDPWRFNNRHINDYRHFRGNRSQVVIRNSHDNRYSDSRRNEVRWYDDSRGKNNKWQGRDSNYGRDRGHDNNGRSAAAQRSTNKNGRDSNLDRKNNNHREYSKPENKGNERWGSRSDKKYAEVVRSQGSDRSSDKNKEKSSSRTDKGRSSASGRR